MVAAIGDASTAIGLLLTGMGERNERGVQNFFIVERDTTDERSTKLCAVSSVEQILVSS